ncbi:hypothetical protein LOTGIDRAFT_238269 [Lottia gigantea]|uniref:Alpha-1,4-N-acetylglucosaminyltransferase n=1 Tax=Lottia gigantea TaxID=225164 RepID=V4AC06_LOTGI|nr:hypothetical protein LOTGIDRAFT_238269 [Lottia gigantea]ESP01529.1 hypothetical protein LOTGIDRAFT_238269 [Lottia gigantea]
MPELCGGVIVASLSWSLPRLGVARGLFYLYRMIFKRGNRRLWNGLLCYIILTLPFVVIFLSMYNSETVHEQTKFLQSNAFFKNGQKMVEALIQREALSKAPVSHETCNDLELIKIPDATVDSMNRTLFCDDVAEDSDVVCRLFFNKIGLEEGKSCLRPKDGYLVPKIVYYVIFGPYTFQFWHYVSMMSAKRIIKPWGLYVVGDAHPVGYWWKRAMKDIRGLRFVYRELPPTIANKKVTWNHHLSDLVRLQMLMLNGGIYLDLDMIVINSLDPIRNHDITMGLIENGTGMGNAIILAQRHSPFVKEWYDAYAKYDNKQFYKNSLHVPRDMWHKNPSRIHMESDKFYRPNWFEADLLFKKNDYPWQNNYAVHIWTNGNPVPKGFEELKTLNTTIGQIFRYVLYGDPSLPVK